MEEKYENHKEDKKLNKKKLNSKGNEIWTNERKMKKIRQSERNKENMKEIMKKANLLNEWKKIWRKK